MGGNPPPAHACAHFHKGLVGETLPKFVQSQPPDFGEALLGVNFDLDLYDGTVSALQGLSGHLKAGALLHFHELYPKPRGPRSMRGHHRTRNSTGSSDELRAIRSHLQRHRTSLWLLLPHTATLREAAVALVLRGQASRLPSREVQDRTTESLHTAESSSTRAKRRGFA